MHTSSPTLIHNLLTKFELPYFPPVPAAILPHLKSKGEYCFATRDLPTSIFDISTYMTEAESLHLQDYAMIGFGGYGLANQALHFYCISGMVGIFMQASWGNAYSDANFARNRIEGAFGLIQMLFSAADKLKHMDTPSKPKRIIVKFSDFAPSGWYWTGQEQEWHADGDYTLANAIKAVRSADPAWKASEENASI
jgi:hypothetical protein